MVIKSPNGPGSYNCGNYNKKFDPQESPFLIFTIDAEHFDLHNGKIDMNKATPITAQFYQQHGPEILDQFPVLYGKITQDDNGRTVAQTYELVKAGEKTVWRKSDTLINISDEIGMSKSNLCNAAMRYNLHWSTTWRVTLLLLTSLKYLWILTPNYNKAS